MGLGTGDKEQSISKLNTIDSGLVYPRIANNIVRDPHLDENVLELLLQMKLNTPLISKKLNAADKTQVTL